MDKILKEIPQEVRNRAQKIKAILFDVDGVLTDGSIIYTNSGDEIKAFNVKDGQIISHLKRLDFVVGAITGRESALVERRCQELKLDYCFQGAKDKFQIVQDIAAERGLKLDEVAYIGDDIIDLRVIKNVGLGAAPADALSYVKDEAHFITKKSGGNGVLRELGDMILAQQGKLKQIIEDHT
ncbi:KdsC family phosphatase [Fulvivirga lutimaris]|uniref:KdsC family phosphatase n=1 Tax=Fulvivirga lutimaris TaxID=1819566 RepID=UPI0012BBFD44|nr:HAD hydrolase family protein [Fulvivirga lutimaris]MTI38349.1 3-deoxy-manno-octulosonate-8-phosphatase [Fulvivirga lutimaris]